MRCDSCMFLNPFVDTKKDELIICDSLYTPHGLGIKNIDKNREKINRKCESYIKKSEKSAWDILTEDEKNNAIKHFGKEGAEVLKKTDCRFSEWLCLEDEVKFMKENGVKFPGGAFEK